MTVQIKKLLSPFKKIKLIWMLHTAFTKIYFQLSALYHGLAMNKDKKGNLFNFRRNIHRIEKGLGSKKRNESFAESYIQKTVKYLETNQTAKLFDKNTLNWGVSVLNEYFKSNKHTANIEKAFKKFQSLHLLMSESQKILYLEKQRPQTCISYDELLHLAKKRKSIRCFLDKTVDGELIKKAMKISALSPSACNRQAFKFLFFNEKEMVQKLSSIPEGIKGYTLPSIIFVINQYRGYFDERDMNAPIIDGSLAVMSFLFALETLGLASVCLNWKSSKQTERDVRKLIHLNDDEMITLVIGVGYPDPEGGIPFSEKRGIQDLLSINDRIKKSNDE